MNICFFVWETAEPGIGCNGCTPMTRHLNLRNDCDIPFGCIRNNLPDLILGIKTSIADIIVSLPWPFADHRSVAPGTHFSKAWIFLYLDAPALIFGQMPVKFIHFVHREIINEFLYEGHRHNMATY